jgi:AraC-like DNA-binding protein
MILSALEEHIVVSRCRLYSIELILEQKVAVICNAMEKKVKDETIGKSIAAYISSYIKEQYAFGTKIAMGRIQDNPFKINASFLEAAVVMADFITSTKQIAAFEDVMEQENDGYEYPVIEQAMYIQSIKQGNKDMALKAMNEMAVNIGKTDFFPITQCLCFDIINMMIKVSGALKLPLTRADIKALTAFSDIESFSAQVKELTEGLCDRYHEMMERRNSLIKTEIINHINGNFCNNQFGLQQVADIFDISPNYLSRLLKQETGHSFIEYVSLLRMDKVKDLLVTTDMQVKDIVGQVGYLDTASFLRKFKAAEGITPSQFRERMRKWHVENF